MLGRKHAQGIEHALGHPAITDQVTGLANRLHFELVYSYLFSGGNRGLSFTVMLLSVGGPDGVPESRLRAVGQQQVALDREVLSLAHHDHSASVLCHNRHIVGDDNHCVALYLVQIGQEIHDLV